MSLDAAEGSPSVPTEPALATGARGLVGWICTSNPFYVLSALLVWLGLWVSFGAQEHATQTWALMSGMTGYTLLLAVTAGLLVRTIRVWDDVRTVMLLVVLMCLATSVTFDEVLARDPDRGIACYLGGLVFAVIVSQGMLWGTRLTLPFLFRVPYYLMLALFFLYPVALSPLVEHPRSKLLEWALFGFAPLAGLISLTLLPAIRRGRDYVRDNGSPWPWAWYPWTLFGVLGFAIMARSALLAWSMHHVERGTAEPYIFGFYFLVPFLLCVGVLLLEIGKVERHNGTLAAALLVPPILVLLASVGHRYEVVYRGFLAEFHDRLGGTPLYLTLLASMGFYAYAVLRRVPAALTALTGSLMVLAFFGPDSLDLGSTVSARPIPFLAIAALQLGLGWRRRNSWRCLLGTICLVVAVTFAFVPLPYQVPATFHLALIGVWILGAIFDDELGRALRDIGVTMVVAGCALAMIGAAKGPSTLPAWVFEVYPPAMCLLVAAYGFGLKHRPAYYAAGSILALWLISFVGRGYGVLRQMVTGLDYIVVGMILFSLAVLTSMVKGGVKPWERLTRKPETADPLD